MRLSLALCGGALAVSGQTDGLQKCETQAECTDPNFFCMDAENIVRDAPDGTVGFCRPCQECEMHHDAVGGACPPKCTKRGGAKAKKKPLVETMVVDSAGRMQWGLDMELLELLGEDGVPQLLPQTYGEEDADGNLKALPGLMTNLGLEALAAEEAAQHGAVGEQAAAAAEASRGEQPPPAAVQAAAPDSAAAVAHPGGGDGGGKGKGNGKGNGNGQGKGSAPKFYPGSKLPYKQGAALLALWRSTHGPQWRKHAWPTDPATKEPTGDCCTWPGVQCVADREDAAVQHVFELSFEHTFGAGGTLPREIGDLERVVTLDLGSNMLTGTLPREMARLGSLNQVEADGNHFVGAIPAEYEALRALSRGPARGGAPSGGARVFLGFNRHPSGQFGFGCPYPAFMNEPTQTKLPGSTVATGFGLRKECGLLAKDATPDEEEPLVDGEAVGTTGEGEGEGGDDPDLRDEGDDEE
jgi:hypothetical protein